MVVDDTDHVQRVLVGDDIGLQEQTKSSGNNHFKTCISGGLALIKTLQIKETDNSKSNTNEVNV